MHIALGFLALVGAAMYWLYRVRNAAEMATDLAHAANDVRLAARRYGFVQQTNIHPIESVEDPRVAAAGILSAFIAMSGRGAEERHDQLLIQMQSVFDIDKTEAEELSALGSWLAAQCPTPTAAVSRLARKLDRLAGAAAIPDLVRMTDAVFTDETGSLPENIDADLCEIRARYHRR